ncbi:hypothetical protein [Candidatus Solincola tengchongensis]|uniref:hypothetical protein n=1 Tax=Candidatus Solincola tengchongensis TaxID=2900693 RepID=UPI00258075B2|nr:hypothetical protein [Candidatus Solincola tengchongensis]
MNVWRKRGDKGRKRGYRHTVRLLRSYLHPVDPDPAFSRRLEDLCRGLGADDLLVAESEPAGYFSTRRGKIIGGAIFSALPFLGVAAYAINKHLTRRRAVALGV